MNETRIAPRKSIPRWLGRIAAYMAVMVLISTMAAWLWEARIQRRESHEIGESVKALMNRWADLQRQPRQNLQTQITVFKRETLGLETRAKLLKGKSRTGALARLGLLYHRVGAYPLALENLELAAGQAANPDAFLFLSEVQSRCFWEAFRQKPELKPLEINYLVNRYLLPAEQNLARASKLAHIERAYAEGWLSLGKGEFQKALTKVGSAAQEGRPRFDILELEAMIHLGRGHKKRRQLRHEAALLDYRLALLNLEEASREAPCVTRFYLAGADICRLIIEIERGLRENAPVETYVRRGLVACEYALSLEPDNDRAKRLKRKLIRERDT